MATDGGYPAAANYITQHGYHKVLLVKDANEGDSYAQTLASAFAVDVKPAYTEHYRSPLDPLNLATREQLMVTMFAEMHSDICGIRPDLIYFAGRGTEALRCFQWVTQREELYAGSGWVRVGSWSLAAVR